MSPSVLLTAFEPFGPWPTNASALCLNELLQNLPLGIQVTPRIYPVEFDAVRQLLEADLTADFDFCVHLGQVHQTDRLRLESIAVNVGSIPGETCPPRVLSSQGPVAYRTSLPLETWVAELQQADIPSYVSYHAGTYLCNATMYWSHELAEQKKLKTRSCFVHIPLDDSQTTDLETRLPKMSRKMSAAGVRLILNSLAHSPTISMT